MTSRKRIVWVLHLLFSNCWIAAWFSTCTKSVNSFQTWSETLIQVSVLLTFPQLDTSVTLNISLYVSSPKRLRDNTLMRLILISNKDLRVGNKRGAHYLLRKRFCIDAQDVSRPRITQLSTSETFHMQPPIREWFFQILLQSKTSRCGVACNWASVVGLWT